MKRRWAGVFLALYSSISMLLFAIPAYAYSECHWVDRDHILCDNSANFTKATSGSFNGSYLLNGNFSDGVINQITSGNTKAVLTTTSGNTGNTTNITLGNPQNASAAPGSNNTPSAITCDWVDKTTITCGADKFVTSNGGGSYIFSSPTLTQINQISGDHTTATKVVVTGIGGTTGTQSTPVKLTNPQNATKDPPVAAGATDTTKPVDCDAGPGFTWIICGLIKLAVSAVEAIRDNIIVPFLKEPALDKNLPQFQAPYAIWSAFRNIASAFFILVFFLVIIGTAVGFDNYTIKKVLPHLVAGAILVPFSWYFCGFIIGIGNVLGRGIVDLVNTLHLVIYIDLTSNFQLLFFGIAGVGAGTALMMAAAPIGMGVVMSMLIALIGVFLTLVLRKIFIMLAVILSPFAILAWVLPNTSKWFTEWWKNFFKLVMMYPIIMLLFEAGRIFSATAGATVTGTPADWVTPVLQIMGLILPLFMVPFAFKFAGKGLAAGSNAVGKFTGGMDKRFGKDSEMAKMAAKNRQTKGMERGRILGEKGVTKLGKAGYGMASRLAYRRAGAPKPFSSKAKGFGSNPAGLIAHEEAYGAAMATLGKASSTNEKKLQNLPGESAAARLQAETQMALNQKMDGQAAREGIVRNAAQGTNKLGDANRAIYEAAAEQKRKDLFKKGGEAMGYNDAATKKPMSGEDLTTHARKMSEVSELEGRAVIKGELDISKDLDAKAIQDAIKSGTGPISVQRAHEMRMENLARSAETKAGNKLMDHDKEALVQNDYSDKATQAEMDRAKAAGHPISRAQALNNRMDTYFAANVSRDVNSKLTEEGKDIAYNEMEAKAGGRLSGAEVIASARANNRQSLADERAKLETGQIGDKVSTDNMLDTARTAAAKTFGGNESNVEAQAIDNENEARLNGINLAAPGGKLAANLAAAQQSFEAKTITQSQNLAKASNEERAAINVAAADARLSGQVPGSRAANVHAAQVAGEAARIEKEKQLGEHIGQEQAVIDQNKKLPVTPEQYILKSRDEAGRQLMDKATGVVAAANEIEAATDAEMKAHAGMSRQAAAAAVRSRRLNNVKDAGLLKGATVAAAGVQAEAETGQAARKLVGAAAARIAANPATPAGTNVVEQARMKIAATRARATGRAAGVKFTEDVESDLGAAETLDNSVQEILNDPANAGMSREAAEERAQAKQFTDAGNTARDISGRRLETEMATKDGSSYGAELAIKNQIEADSKNPDLPPLPPNQARARAKANILKAVGTDARNTAAENRIAVTRKAKGSAENYEAALQIQSERDFIAPQKEAASNAKRLELENNKEKDKIKDQKIEEFKKTADPDTLSDTDKMKQVERDAEEFAKSEIDREIEQAGEEKAASLRRDIAKGASNGGIDLPPINRTSTEEALFTAAGDAAEEEAGVSEATTQGRRIAYSEAFRSDKRTPDKARIEGTIRQSIDARAKEAALAKVKENEKARSFDTAFEANMNVEEQKQMKMRSEEASKLRFGELDSDYQAEIEKVGGGTNPFGNLPLGEVDQNNTGNAGLAAVVKQAIKKKDWHIAQAALEHLSNTNGGFELAKQLQYVPVAQGGFGGTRWDQVDKDNPQASMLRYVWDQSIGVASKGNPDANKPIAVAAKAWKAEKLSAVNDKYMGRVIEHYHEEPQILENQIKASNDEIVKLKAAGVPETAPEYVQAASSAKDAQDRLNLVNRAKSDFEKTARALLDHPQLDFDPDALRALVNDEGRKDKDGKPIEPIIKDAVLRADLKAKYEGKYKKKTT